MDLFKFTFGNDILISLTHWGRTSIRSDNGLLPGRRQAIIWNNAVILLIGRL